MNRKERMQSVLTILKENGGSMPFLKLYGAVSEKLGVTKKTFRSYLEALKAQGKINYPAFYMVGAGGEILTISLVEKA